MLKQNFWHMQTCEAINKENDSFLSAEDKVDGTIKKFCYFHDVVEGRGVFSVQPIGYGGGWKVTVSIQTVLRAMKVFEQEFEPFGKGRTRQKTVGRGVRQPEQIIHRTVEKIGKFDGGL